MKVGAAGPIATAYIANIRGHAACADFPEQIKVRVVSTAAYSEGNGGVYRDTVASILAYDRKILDVYYAKHPNTKPAAIIIAKIDSADIDTQTLYTLLPTFLESLRLDGIGLYCIDVTQDFSGTLDRKAMLQHLVSNHNFIDPNSSTLPEPTQDRNRRIIDNEESVGSNCLSFLLLQPNYGSMWRGKFYNKFVCQIECAGVQDSLGNNVANYCECPDRRLAETFANKDIQERGICRIEVSLYGIRPQDATYTNAIEAVEETLTFSRNPQQPLFWKQPIVEQWKALANTIHCNCILLSKETKTLYAIYWGHSKTKRMCGISKQYPDQELDVLENSYLPLWISAFGFVGIPIHAIVLESSDGEKIHTTLRTYQKLPTDNIRLWNIFSM